MAEQADRTYKRVRVIVGSGANQYVDIPVLEKCNFRAMQEQAQDYQFIFDNSENNSREVHLKRIANPDDENQYIDVERIDQWLAKVMAEQAQERTFVLKNDDPPPIQPDGSNNPSHEETHVVRYGSGDQYIDVELIDKMKITDTTSQYQEWIYYLRHPEKGSPINDPDVSYTVYQGECDSNLELLDQARGPYRTDPFSNIVNVGWPDLTAPSEIWVEFAWSGPQFFTDTPPPNTWSTGFSASGPVVRYFDFGHQESGWTIQPPIGVRVTGFPSFSTYGETWEEAIGFFYKTGANSFNISITPDGGPEEIRPQTVTLTGVTCSWTDSEGTANPMTLQSTVWSVDLGTAGAAMGVIYSFLLSP